MFRGTNLKQLRKGPNESITHDLVPPVYQGHNDLVTFRRSATRVRSLELEGLDLYWEFHRCIRAHSPLRYWGTVRFLEQQAELSLIDWEKQHFVSAVDLLEHSRHTWQAYEAAFVARRRAEKRLGMRQATAGDLAAWRRHEWLRDPAEAAVRRTAIDPIDLVEAHPPPWHSQRDGSVAAYITKAFAGSGSAGTDGVSWCAYDRKAERESATATPTGQIFRVSELSTK